MTARRFAVGIMFAGVAVAACGTEDPGRSSAGERTSTPGPACDRTAVITGEGLGPLRVGRTVEEVEAACERVRDFVAPGAEGMSERYLAVDFGPATVQAIVVENRVWRIHVESATFLTEDSLGVGVPLSRLLRFSDLAGARGEGGLYVFTPAHCGLSFRLSRSRAASRHGGAWTREALAALPPETEVREVLIFGCDG